MKFARKMIFVTGLAVLMASAQPVLAQAYPSKPIRFLVGFAPGIIVFGAGFFVLALWLRANLDRL